LVGLKVFLYGNIPDINNPAQWISRQLRGMELACKAGSQILCDGGGTPFLSAPDIHCDRLIFKFHRRSAKFVI